VRPLNESQRRHILTTFAHVDALLEEANRVAGGNSSPLGKEQADVTGEEARLLRSLTDVARFRMVAALDHLAIPHPMSSLSARWSAQTALQFADLALSELGPQSLRGYGPVDPGAANELVALATEIRGIVERAIRLLQGPSLGGDREPPPSDGGGVSVDRER
jgi:hypothetical protein